MTFDDIHDLVIHGNDMEKGICQICVIKDGNILYQDNWRRFRNDSAVQVMSVTKGVMALLTGIAIDCGYIDSVEQKVIDFFPDYKVKRGEKTIYDVTIQHLLTMTAPFKFRSEPWKKVCTTDNWAEAALDLLGGRSGISGNYRYTTLGLQILSGIIEKASGISCINLANEKLFAPLEIPKHGLHLQNNYDQFSYMMKKSPRDNEWYADPNGTVTAGWGLTLSAYDMAKIGTMVLNRGSYNNNQVISEEWINRMTSPMVPTGDTPDSYYYGYLWYRPYKDRNIYAAIGTGGNLIYANDELKMSVGITATSRLGIDNNIGFIERNIINRLF